MFAFGLWLGLGFLTYSPYAGLHLFALAAILQGSLAESVLIFGLFGLARGATVIAAGLSASTWDADAHLADRIAARYTAAHRLTAAGLAAVALTAAVSLVLR